MYMTLIRIVFLGLAVLLPVSWTAVQAADEAPSGETKKAKKTKKGKKADKDEGSEEKKAE
jgi:hypothetical protein